MALVAALGALAAFHTATAEQVSAERQNRLHQRGIIELTKSQEYLDRFGQRARLEDEYYPHVLEGNRLRDDHRDVEAQAEFDVARILRPYLAETWLSGMDSHMTVRDIIDKNVAYDLRRMGFGSKLLDEIKTARTKVVSLTRLVIVFVAALGCLTLAELWRRKSSRMLVMLALGIVVAMRGVFLTIRIDPDWMFLWFAVAFPVLGFFGSRLAPYLVMLARKISVRLGFLSPFEVEEEVEGGDPRPGEMEPLIFPWVRAHVGQARHAFSILVILLIVVTVLLSAILGYAYSKATTEADRIASNAADRLVDGFKTSHSASSHFVLGELASVQTQRVAYKAALQQLDLARLGLLTIDQKKVKDDVSRLKNLLDSQVFITGILDGKNGPDGDPKYPNGILFGPRNWESYAAFAQADAGNELSLAFHDRAQWYLMTLTFFAIALYLFGQSLTIRRLKAASTLVFFAVCLIVLGTGIAILQGSKTLPGSHAMKDECRDKEAKAGDVRSTASRHYAEGMIRYERAATPEEYAAAAKELECAVNSRPKFALGNYYLARAASRQASPQVGERYTSLVTEEKMQQIVNHEGMAVKGLDQGGLAVDASLMGGYGFDSYLLGLIQKNQKLIAFGLEETRAAIHQDVGKEHPFLRFNLGLISLASGKQPEATVAYREALRTPPTVMQNELAAASINDLGVFLYYCRGIRHASYCKNVEDLARNLKQQFVEAAWPVPKDRADPMGPGPQLTKLEPVATPAGLGWRARRDNFQDPALEARNLRGGPDMLAVMWYKYEDKWKLWRLLPHLSGKVEWQNTRLDDAGIRHEFRSYLRATNQDRCAEKGEYRAEFYLNGKLLNLDPHVSLDFPPLTAATFHDLNISLCHPNTWGERWRPKNSLDGFITGGYTVQDHSRGVFVFNYYLPRSSLNESVKTRFAERSLAYLSLNKFSPDFEVSNEPNTCPAYPPGQTMIRAKSRDGTVTAVARVWPSEEGILHVGVALHRSGTVADSPGTVDVLGPKTEECNALRSMREVYGPY